MCHGASHGLFNFLFYFTFTSLTPHTMNQNVTWESANVFYFENENQHHSQMLERLRHEREAGRFCDLVLHVDGEEIGAHRLVMAAASPYFDSIFKTKKTVKERLIINACSGSVFRTLLSYIYTGTVFITADNVKELLRLANHFLLFKLKTYCAQYLDRHLDAKTCMNTRELSDKYGLPEVHRKVSEFIVSHLHEIVKQPQLLEMTLSQFERFITDKKLNISKEISMIKLITRWVNYLPEERLQHLRYLLEFVSWKDINPNALYELLQMDPFYQKQPIALFYLLGAAKDHQMDPIVMQCKYLYRALMHQFGTRRVSRRTFFEMAFETLVESMGNSPNTAGQQDVAASLLAYLQQQQQLSPFQAAATNSNGSFLKGSDAETNLLHDGLESSVHHQTLTPLQATMDAALLAASRDYAPSGSRDYAPTPGSSSGASSSFRQASSSVPFDISIAMKPDDTESKVQHLESANCNVEEDELNVEDLGDLEEGEAEEESASSANSSGYRPNFHRCDRCIFVGKTQAILAKHKADIHTTEITYRCVICTFTCTWNTEYYRHLKNVHFPGGKPYRCDICKQFKSGLLERLLQHRKCHSDERPFECEYCEYRCRQKSNLEAHIRTHTGEKPFLCSVCGKGFAIKASLEQHKLTHSDSKNYLCELCGFAAKYQSQLAAHKRMHTGDVLRCQFASCSFVSTKKSKLENHMRTHTAVRSHICPQCGRAFIEKSHLVRHQRIHLQDKPFKCDQCEYSSSRRDKLKEHTLKHHKMNPTETSSTTGSATKSTPRQPPRRRGRSSKLFQQAEDALMSEAPSTSGLNRPPETGSPDVNILTATPQNQHTASDTTPTPSPPSVLSGAAEDLRRLAAAQAAAQQQQQQQQSLLRQRLDHHHHHSSSHHHTTLDQFNQFEEEKLHLQQNISLPSSPSPLALPDHHHHSSQFLPTSLSSLLGQHYSNAFAAASSANPAAAAAMHHHRHSTIIPDHHHFGSNNNNPSSSASSHLQQHHSASTMHLEDAKDFKDFSDLFSSNGQF